MELELITMNDNGWKIDEHEKRYRETAPGHREFEMTVTVSGGLEIPVSQLEDYHRRQKEADEKRRAAAQEEFNSRPPTRYCPFVSGTNTQCKREKCSLFLDGRCSIAILADAHGMDHPIVKGTKCPFSVYAHCDGCALNNGGCAVVRLAAATNNK